MLAVAVLPSGWTGLLPGSRGRVPIAEIRMSIRKKTKIFEREKAFTLFIDRIRDATLLILVHLENTLVDAALRLLIGPRNQGIRYSSKENEKKLAKTYVTKRITMTVVNRILQDAFIPSVNEV